MRDLSACTASTFMLYIGIHVGSKMSDKEVKEKVDLVVFLKMQTTMDASFGNCNFIY